LRFSHYLGEKNLAGGTELGPKNVLGGKHPIPSLSKEGQ